MSESEKKGLYLEELEEVSGGTFIDNAMDFIDETGAVLNMSVRNELAPERYYIQIVETGEMKGPYTYMYAVEKSKEMKAAGIKVRVYRKP